MLDALTSAAPINTHEMVVIHRAFRRESRLLGDLIAAAPDGDTERAAVLGRHLAWYQSGLTNHHHGEDELLWPLLHQRRRRGRRDRGAHGTAARPCGRHARQRDGRAAGLAGVGRRRSP